MASPPHPVTETLRQIRLGQREAAKELVPLLYEELRRLAEVRVRGLPPGQTLQATVLVHETYLRVVGEEDQGWEGRRHFFGSAAKAMRYVMVDEVRRKRAQKRGGDGAKVSLQESQLAGPPSDFELVALSEAMDQLSELDARKAQVVDLRYFAGFTVEETAKLLEVSTSTVEKDWKFARSWLASQLQVDPTD